MGRADEYAARFEAEQQALIDLLEPLTPEQWRRSGANHPQRINEEDERRPVGVIAHHVALSAPGILDRLLAVAEGRPAPPVADFQAENARHAAEHAAVEKAEVLALLAEQRGRIVAALRGLTEDQLDRATETPAGRMTVSERIERVLIGHVAMHRGSIETALSTGP